MNEEARHHLTIEQLVFFGIFCAAIYLFIRWCRNAKPGPDPWGEEIERELQGPEAHELCRRCLAPTPERGWFCEHCGASIGPYNNYIPYVDVFAQGEVLRAGTHDHLRRSPLIILGYVLLSLAMLSVFAPIYLFFMLRHLVEQDEQTDEETMQVG